MKRARVCGGLTSTSAMGLLLALSAGKPRAASESGGAGTPLAPAKSSPSHIAWTKPKIDRFKNVSDAVMASLSPETAVVAFGELHQRTATARARSTLSVFTGEVLPTLAPRLSHLVVETWVTTGACGAAEKAAVAEVETKTERPRHVENELVVLLTRAKSLGVSPQILTIDCASYQAMVAGDATPALDFEKTLAITTNALTKKILAVLGEPPKALQPAWQGLSQDSSQRASQTPSAQGPLRDPSKESPKDAAGPRRLVAVYGGALHNDLFPDPDLAAYSFAAQVERQVPGGYVEIDLFLPALIAASAKLLAPEPWFRAYQRSRPKKGEQGVLRVARAPGSYVIVPSVAALAAGKSP